MEFEIFIRKIGDFTGINLTKYKRPQMQRRITSLMRLEGFADYGEYLRELKGNGLCLKKFINHLTINVSEFYRNPSQWDLLKEQILPEIIKFNPAVKIWSAGCATGEEPYTLAIMLREHFPKARPRILATDIDEGVLLQAKEGIYKSRALVNVPPHQLRKYFLRMQEDACQVKDEIKKMVVFRRHDLLKDYFPARCDLIICRNVMIYFTEEAKSALYRMFSDALRPGGVLFTGSTEQIFQAPRIGLEAVASFFYRKAL